MSESAGPRPVSKVARRTLLAGAAWAVPTVAVLSATPAFAASPPMLVANKNLEKMAGGLRVHVGLNNPLPTKLTATCDRVSHTRHHDDEQDDIHRDGW